MNTNDLIQALGLTLVAYLSGRESVDPDYDDFRHTRAPEKVRIEAACRAWEIITEDDEDSVARAWFIGANELLGSSAGLSDTAPVTALRNGRVLDVIAAAKAFAEQ